MMLVFSCFHTSAPMPSYLQQPKAGNRCSFLSTFHISACIHLLGNADTVLLFRTICFPYLEYRCAYIQVLESVTACVTQGYSSCRNRQSLQVMHPVLIQLDGYQDIQSCPRGAITSDFNYKKTCFLSHTPFSQFVDWATLCHPTCAVFTGWLNGREPALEDWRMPSCPEFSRAHSMASPEIHPYTR